MDTQVSGANSWLRINNQPVNFDSEHENRQLNIKEYSRNTIRITDRAPDDLSIFLEERELETARHGIWDWNPKHYAGLYQLVVRAPDYASQTTWIRVFPHKFLQPIYEKMKDELSQMAIDLLFHLNSPAVERARFIPRTQDTSALHDYKQIRFIIEKMRDIMLHICREPYATLYTYSIQQNIQETTRFSRDATPISGARVRLPESIARKNNVQTVPQQWNVQHSGWSYDNDENRLLKRFLQKQLIAKLNLVQEHAEREKKQIEDTYARYHNPEDAQLVNKLTHAIAECRKMKQRCIHWSSESFLQTVQPVVLMNKATQVLQKNPNYGRFYQLYLQFQQRLQTTIETEKYITALSMRQVYSLYEMWCVFGVTKLIVEELIQAGYNMIANTTFEVNKDLFNFDVRKNVASIILEKDDLHLEIKYEPIYPHQSLINDRSALVATTMGSYPLTPDMALEVYREDKVQAVLIFDAKYRWQKSGNQIFPNPEDIPTMYRYLNNIQYKQLQPGRARPQYKTTTIVTSAYIIYPGNKIHTESNGEIGALPFFPHLSTQHYDAVRKQLNDLLYYAYLID